MMENEHYRKLENMMHSAPIVKLVGARVEISHGQADIILPVNRELFHAAGALHGAMYFLTLDNAAFFAVNSLVEDVFVLTVSFNIYLLRPVRPRRYKSQSEKSSIPQKLNIWRNLFFTTRRVGKLPEAAVFLLKARVKLTPEIGYK